MRIPVLSFFTGAGLIDLGFHSAGFDVVWRNEYFKPFSDGFKHGFAGVFDARPSDFPVCNTSIAELTPYCIRNQAFSGKMWPDAFGVIGGPPCPDFSVAGKNSGQLGDNGKLTGVFFKQIAGLLPTFFVFENVKGILSTSKHRAYLTEELTKLSDSYLFDIKLLNALDVGVPQDRERVVVVGFHKSFFSGAIGHSESIEIAEKNQALLKTGLQVHQFEKYSWFTWPYCEEFYHAKKNFTWPTTNPFGQKTQKPKNIPLQLCVGHYLENLENLKNQDEFFVPRSQKFHEVQEGDVSRKSFKRLHRWRYSPTAAYGNNEVHLHPFLPRRLSVREAMRIQTVPDTFALPEDMTLSNKFKTVGNGVPVKLAELIAKEVSNVFHSNGGMN